MNTFLKSSKFQNMFKNSLRIKGCASTLLIFEMKSEPVSFLVYLNLNHSALHLWYPIYQLSRVDPDSRCSMEQDTPMELATHHDHMEVVLALAEYTEVPEKTKKSNSWLLMQIEKQASEIRQLRDEMGAVRELLSTVLKEAK